MPTNNRRQRTCKEYFSQLSPYKLICHAEAIDMMVEALPGANTITLHDMLLGLQDVLQEKPELKQRYETLIDKASNLW